MVARKHNAAGASRGGIAKRRGTARADKDGDLVMDSSSRGDRGGRGGISKAKPKAPAARDSTTRSGRAPRSTVNTTRLAQELHKNVASGEGTIRAPRGLEELRITGWTNSKAATSSDGGVTSLITWLERKATLKSNNKRPVKVKKVCQHLTTGSSLTSLSYPVRLRLLPISERRPPIDILEYSHRSKASPSREKNTNV